MIRATTADAPAPKIKATRLKSNKPTSNHTNAPTIVKVKAIIVVIFIFFPPKLIVGRKNFFIPKLARFLKLICQRK